GLELVNIRLLLELAKDEPDQCLIDIIPAQVRVAAGRENLEDAFAQFQDRDVKRAAAEIVHGDDALLALVQPIGERRRRWLVYDPQNIQTGDAARVFRRLPLRVIKVCGNGDDRV